MRCVLPMRSCIALWSCRPLRSCLPERRWGVDSVMRRVGTTSMQVSRMHGRMNHEFVMHGCTLQSIQLTTQVRERIMAHQPPTPLPCLMP